MYEHAMEFPIIITKWLARFPHELPIISWYMNETIQGTVIENPAIKLVTLAKSNTFYHLPKLLIDDDDDTLLIRSWPNPSVLSTLYVLFGESIFNLSLELIRLIPLNGDNVSTTRSFRLFSSANANVTNEFSKCNTIHWSATTNSCKIIHNFFHIKNIKYIIKICIVIWQTYILF